jgi:signal transduction histidine kinase/CheY-like chemotaxis protein
MQHITARIGPLAERLSRFVPATVATVAGVTAGRDLHNDWRFATAIAVCIVVVASIPQIKSRIFQWVIGSLEAAIVTVGIATFPPGTGAALLVILVAAQGLHHPQRAFGGVAGFVVIAMLDADVGFNGAAIAIWALACTACALVCLILQFRAGASMRNFRAFGHEFRTPLTNILQNAQMGMRTSPTAAQRGYLDNIALAARHMDILLSNVLDFLKLMTGNYVANASDVDLVLLVDNLFRLVQPLSNVQQVRLHGMCHGPLVQLRTNADAVRISLLNLLSNAIKFTQDGHVAIISRTSRDSRGYRLRVRAVDSGVGVPEKLRGKLFTEFTTGEPWNRVQRGSGLGLALVRELVERMGGSVFYHPREQGGSEFGFEIPVDPAESPELKQLTPCNFLLLSTDSALRGALHARAKQVEYFTSLDLLKGALAARPDINAIVIIDARDLTISIDRAGIELERISKAPLFAILEPADDLSAIEIDLAFCGFRSLFDARLPTESVAEWIAHTASSLTATGDGPELNAELRSSFAGRVLIVEDDPMQLRYLALTLGHSGIVALCAGSLAEARSIMGGAADIRLLIVDFNLPDGTASMLIREIREREQRAPEPSRMPIAVITAEDRQLAVADLKGVDYDWFQSKPITDPLRLVRMAAKRLESQGSGLASARPAEQPSPAGAELSAILAPDFALAAGEALANILAEAKARRWSDVYRHAHKLKGLAALMNERSLADLCAKVDRRSIEPKDSAVWLASLDAEVRRAIDRAGKRVPARL